MGVGLSCLGGQSSPPENPMKPASPKIEDKTTCSVGSTRISVFSFFKSSCFSTRNHPSAVGGSFHSSSVKTNHHPDMEMEMKRPLGEWLADPSPTSGRTTFGSSMESFIFMSFSKKVHPSSSVHNPRDSFSKEKMLKDEEVKREEDGGLGSQTQKGKKKKKKKVSFRLPEDNEIITFPPSPDSEEEDPSRCSKEHLG